MFTTQHFNLAFVMFSLILKGEIAQARWRSTDEATAEQLTLEIVHKISKDGTSKVSYRSHAKCLLDDCRDQIGTMVIVFNKSAAKLVNFKGSTRVGDRWIAADKKAIDTRDAAGFFYGFDDLMRTMVAFPDVKVGTEIKQSWQLEKFKNPVPGFYSDQFFFNEPIIYRKGAKIQYISEIPLTHFVAGPEGYLKVTDWQKGLLYYKSVELIKDAYFSVTDEKSSYYGADNSPRILVSSHTKWDKLSRELAKGFERSISSALPPIVKKQVEIIRSQSNDILDQTNAVTSWLSENIRYMGDWRTVDGYFAPRPLIEIMSTGYGDCKDYAAITTAMLRALGYRADVASVYRGSWGNSNFELPNLEAFNHAIVKLTVSDRRILWIDPTNRTSFANGKRPDIADKKALALTAEGSNDLDNIPRIEAEESLTEVHTELTYLSTSSRAEKSKIKIRGVAALDLTGLEMFSGREDAKEALIAQVELDRNLETEISELRLTSRIVRDLYFETNARGAWIPATTTAGYYHPIPSLLPNLQTLSLSDRVTGFKFGDIGTTKKTLRIKNVQLIGKEPELCHLDSPWLAASREIISEDDDIMIQISTVIKQRHIHIRDLISKEGEKLIQDLRTCFGEQGIVFEPRREL